jgi:ribosomal-protein-alanine N-acetyltransferase
MSNGVIVRHYTDNDKDVVHSIQSQAQRELTPLSAVLRYYDIPDDGFLVADVDYNVAGFIIFTTRTTTDEQKEGHILSIATDSNYKRKGIGQALIEKMIEKMKDSDINRIGLEVKISNTAAHNFYYKLGFKKSHIIPRYYRMRGYTEDALSMVLKF